MQPVFRLHKYKRPQRVDDLIGHFIAPVCGQTVQEDCVLIGPGKQPGMNLVRREEFDAVQAMAQKARAAQEALEQRVAQLEARLAQPPSEPAAEAPLRSRPATKRAKPAAE